MSNEIEGSKCILLVDDEQMIRRAGQRILMRIGCEVLLAENGEEALKVYRASRERIDAVILDMAMPVMDGLACLAALKKINPKVRVVISSGSLDAPSSDAPVPEGAVGVLPKPYDVQQLKTLFHRMFEIHKEGGIGV